MTKPNFILSLCGTSLLTHGVSHEDRQLINRYANTKDDKAIETSDLAKLKQRIATVRSQLLSAPVETTTRMSAELNALITFYAGQLKGRQDQHWLLCTDTWLGEQTASLVAAKLNDYGIRAQIYRPTDLRTENLEGFQLALSELVKWCSENITPCREQYHVVFNLTGGFKSIQGFLQTLASFYADEAIYIFESQKELLRIPRLPLKLDTQAMVEEHLTVFRRLAKAMRQENVDGIPETLLMTLDGQHCLSPWGELVWQQNQVDLYPEKLWPSPSKKLRFADSFEKSVADQPSDRLLIINQRVDQLAAFLEGGPNLKSLDFKALQGKVADYTHEIDAWSDRDAKRLFGGYEEGGVFVLKALAKHL